MSRPTTRTTAAAALLLAATSVTFAADPIVDGARDAAYGNPLAVQLNPTGFGDSIRGQSTYANGSELDAVYAKVSNGKLFILFTGNLETNFNHLELFIDSVAGGQNTLVKNNVDIDFNALARLGENLDGSNPSASDVRGPGLKFDPGFAADFYLGAAAGGGSNAEGTFGFFANFASLPTAGDGLGQFLGGGDNIQLIENGPTGISVAIDNSNTAGVTGDALNDPAAVTTGVEFAIPLATIGNPTAGPIRITAFINGSGHDFASNQFMAPLPAGTPNPGEPRNLDLSAFADDQYFLVHLLPGDANDNGRIDPDDYASADRGRAKGLAGWANGDFNNDGAVNADDFLILDESFAAQGGLFTPELLESRAAEFGDAYVSSLLAAVPEPSPLVPLAASLPLLSRRRRRHT